MKGISEEFIREFRDRRKDWDLYQLRNWISDEEARIREENPGLYDYINGIINGLRETLGVSNSILICDRLYLHFIELLAIAREHERVEELENLWEK
jgi:hypothetical protein